MKSRSLVTSGLLREYPEFSHTSLKLERCGASNPKLRDSTKCEKAKTQTSRLKNQRSINIPGEGGKPTHETRGRGGGSPTMKRNRGWGREARQTQRGKERGRKELVGGQSSARVPARRAEYHQPIRTWGKG
uniref:Resistance-like protein n=1 Tax=Beta vulgaris subsp. vulgaris TaxID=3555 RepID=J3SID0_BETVV|nr:resistance-like protein [Beta vulgaris subsp. vulgaris]